MNYINNIPLLNDDNDELFKSLIPSMDNTIEEITDINNDSNSSYECSPYTDGFHDGHVNINYLIKDIRCNKNLNAFFFDYTNYSIAENIQTYSAWTPYGSQDREIDVAYSVPFSFTDIYGRNIRTKLNVSLNKRKCFVDLDDPGYVFNIKKNDPSFEIRFAYKDALSKRNFSITPNIKNDFELDQKYNGIKIKATTVNDFLAVCDRVGNGEYALRKISEKYAEAIKNEKDGSELNYLYSNLPPIIMEYLKRSISIPTDTLIDHLYKLVDYDDTGLFSGWRDSSSAILNLLQIIGDSTILYNLFKLNPKLVKRMYYNLDGKILYEGEYIRSRTVFAGILTILAKAHNCEDPEKERITFFNGEHHRILSNQVTSDTIDESYDLTQQSRKTKIIRNKNIGGSTDGSASKQYATYKKNLAWEDKGTHYLEPLDLVYFIDTSWEDKTPILVPAIYVKSISDEKEWKDIHLSIRIGANILAIVLGVASLGASSPLIVALGVVDVGLATGDLLVAVSEDALMKTPEGREFLNVWNKVALGGGLATAGPLLLRSAFRVTGKIFARATNPKTIAFLKESVQNLLEQVQNLPKYRPASIEIISDIYTELKGYFLTSIKNSVVLERLENFRQLGILLIKGEVKIKGILKKEYTLLFEGEVIAKGSLKDIGSELSAIIIDGGKNVTKYLDNIDDTFSIFVDSVKEFTTTHELARKSFNLFRNRQWSKLERLFETNKLNYGWPPNSGGFNIKKITLKVNKTFDRYGGYFDEAGKFKDGGNFVSPIGIPFFKRALPLNKFNTTYRKYRILKPIEAIESTVVPWFGKKGLGIQYQLIDKKIEKLIKDGFIELIE